MSFNQRCVTEDRGSCGFWQLDFTFRTFSDALGRFNDFMRGEMIVLKLISKLCFLRPSDTIFES
jgi:hypothetical protein